MIPGPPVNHGWTACIMAFAVLGSGCAGTIGGENPPVQKELLVNAPPSVFVQVDAVSGRVPSQLALEALTQVMQDVGTEHVEVSVKEGLAAGDGDYSQAELDAIVNKIPPRSSGTTLQILYMDGRFEEDSGTRVTMGLGSFNGYIVVFSDVLPSHSYYAGSTQLPSFPKDQFERSVLIHEYGHVLGLVDCGIKQTKERVDPASDCHSLESDSVMTSDIHSNPDPVDWAIDDAMAPVWRFNPADWQDIRAFQKETT